MRFVRFPGLAAVLTVLALASAPALAQSEDGFLITNVDGDTLFYAAPDGTVLYGPEGRRVTVGAGNEGLVSRVTQSDGFPSAGLFAIDNPDARATALAASHHGPGTAIGAQHFGTGAAVNAYAFNGGNAEPAVNATTLGTGPALAAHQLSGDPALDVARFVTGAGFDESTWRTVARVGADGTLHGAGLGLARSDDELTLTYGVGGEGLVSRVTRAEGYPSAGIFTIDNPDALATTLQVNHNGGGGAFGAQHFGTGIAVGAYAFNGGNPQPAFEAFTLGSGPALRVRQSSGATDGNVAEFYTGTAFDEGTFDLVARVASNGDVYADGAFQGGGADFAERFEVVGGPAAYAVGDVLAISPDLDRHLERAAEPYSTRIVGVYATRPGLILADPRIATDTTVPVGVVGVVPTKVTGEGGPIRRGDLLVTSSTPGHAMRGEPSRIGVGMVIGKALQAFDGAGEGVIEVLVNVQ